VHQAVNLLADTGGNHRPLVLGVIEGPGVHELRAFRSRSYGYIRGRRARHRALRQVGMSRGRAAGYRERRGV